VIILERELEMCGELRKLLETENDSVLQKWPIFTSIFIRKKLGGHEDSIRKDLEFLVKLDSTHAAHYNDLRAAIK